MRRLVCLVLLVQHAVIDALESGNRRQEDSLCSLECLNGGYCRLISQNMTELAFVAQRGSLIEECVCQPGFAGMGCEIQLALEGCQTADSKCNECDEAYQVSAFAGAMCRDPYTEYCGGVFDPTRPAPFCTNGGKCKSDMIAAQSMPRDFSGNQKYEFEGCLCSSEFSGPHCEFLNQDRASASLSGDKDDEPFYLSIIAAWAGAMFVLASFFGYSYWVERQRVRDITGADVVKDRSLEVALSGSKATTKTAERARIFLSLANVQSRSIQWIPFRRRSRDDKESVDLEAQSVSSKTYPLHLSFSTSAESPYASRRRVSSKHGRMKQEKTSFQSDMVNDCVSSKLSEAQVVARQETPKPKRRPNRSRRPSISKSCVKKSLPEPTTKANDTQLPRKKRQSMPGRAPSVFPPVPFVHARKKKGPTSTRYKPLDDSTSHRSSVVLAGSSSSHAKAGPSSDPAQVQFSWKNYAVDSRERIACESDSNYSVDWDWRRYGRKPRPPHEINHDEDGSSSEVFAVGEDDDDTVSSLEVPNEAFGGLPPLDDPLSGNLLPPLVDMAEDDALHYGMQASTGPMVQLEEFDEETMEEEDIADSVELPATSRLRLARTRDNAVTEDDINYSEMLLDERRHSI